MRSVRLMVAVSGQRVGGIALAAQDMHQACHVGDPWRLLVFADYLCARPANLAVPVAALVRLVSTIARQGICFNQWMYATDCKSLRQALPQSLADAPFSEARQRVLARLAPLFAGRPGNPESLRLDAIAIVAEVLGADHRLCIKVRQGQPVFEAATAHEAQLLSGTLPAVERALPGQLSLSTTVRVNVDDRWSIVLAPILEGGQTAALAVLVRRIGRFDADALVILEATCRMLGLRTDAR